MMGARAAMPQAVQTKAQGNGRVGPHSAAGLTPRVPGPILPKTQGPQRLHSGSSFAKAGPILPSGPVQFCRNVSIPSGRQFCPAGRPRSARSGGRFFRVSPFKPSWPPHPFCPVVPLQSRASPVGALQPMMAIGAAVAFGHQVFNSVVAQVGRRMMEADRLVSGISFRQVGVNQRGFPELEAPVSRVLNPLGSGVAVVQAPSLESELQNTPGFGRVGSDGRAGERCMASDSTGRSRSPMRLTGRDSGDDTVVAAVLATAAQVIDRFGLNNNADDWSYLVAFAYSYI